MSRTEFSTEDETIALPTSIAADLSRSLCTKNLPSLYELLFRILNTTGSRTEQRISRILSWMSGKIRWHIIPKETVADSNSSISFDLFFWRKASSSGDKASFNFFKAERISSFC